MYVSQEHPSTDGLRTATLEAHIEAFPFHNWTESLWKMWHTHSYLSRPSLAAWSSPITEINYEVSLLHNSQGYFFGHDVCMCVINIIIHVDV